MAKLNPIASNTPPQRGLVIPIALMTCLGLGAGATFGRMVVAKPEMGARGTDRIASASSLPIPKPANAKHDARPDPTGEPGLRDVSAEHIIALEPIITNIAGTGKTWLRFEGLVVLNERLKGDRSGLTLQITQDISGLLRSTSLRQLETAAGLEFLREDMAELARLRSRGRARDIIIKVLVVE